jgi:hypothetical protein
MEHIAAETIIPYSREAFCGLRDIMGLFAAGTTHDASYLLGAPPSSAAY